MANFNSLLNLSEMSLDTLTSAPRGRFDGIRNDHFAQTEARFTRKKLDTYVHSSLTSLLSVRLREGYTVNSVRILDEANIMEVKLTLPWKINSFIHYTLQSQWPLKGHKCRILVHLEGMYVVKISISARKFRQEKVIYMTLFRNKRFMLDEMFQRKTSKIAGFWE